MRKVIKEWAVGLEQQTLAEQLRNEKTTRYPLHHLAYLKLSAYIVFLVLFKWDLFHNILKTPAFYDVCHCPPPPPVLQHTTVTLSHKNTHFIHEGNLTFRPIVQVPVTIYVSVDYRQAVALSPRYGLQFLSLNVPVFSLSLNFPDVTIDKSLILWQPRPSLPQGRK